MTQVTAEAVVGQFAKDKCIIVTFHRLVKSGYHLPGQPTYCIIGPVEADLCAGTGCFCICITVEDP